MVEITNNIILDDVSIKLIGDIKGGQTFTLNYADVTKGKYLGLYTKFPRGAAKIGEDIWLNNDEKAPNYIPVDLKIDVLVEGSI